MSDAPTTATAPLYGKFRGKVLSNIDPLFQGRLLAEVAALPSVQLTYALPCTPYAGPGVGLHAVPPVGANVWIEFEAGDPNYPIWSGCFWSAEDAAAFSTPLLPETKVFKTDCIELALTDVPATGGFSLRCDGPAFGSPMALTLDATGITLECATATVLITPTCVHLGLGNSSLLLSPETGEIVVAGASLSLRSKAICMEAPNAAFHFNGNLEVAAQALNVVGNVDVEGEIAGAAATYTPSRTAPESA